jgi:hypothetical protein
MRARAIAVFVFALALGTACLAQDMAEYSHAAAGSAVGLNGLANKLNSTLQKSGPQGSAQPHLQTVPGPKSETSKTGAVAANAPAKPTPPAIFILKNGKQIESSHYLLTAQDLTIQDAAKPETIPVSELNRDATTTANQKRGLSISIPNSTSQMTVSF